MVLLQYASDLHLEFGENYALIDTMKSVAPFLALAGDIGDPFSKEYSEFIAKCSRLGFKHVFVVSGNHEYYHTTSMNDTDERIRNVCAQFGNVSYLQNETHEEPDFIVFGSTLWTHYDTDDVASNWWQIMTSVSDFSRIPCFTLQESNRLHHRARTALRDCIEVYRDDPRPIVAVTHHLPCKQLIHEKYKDCPVNGAFACDVPEAASDRIAVWVCGHSHSPIDLGKFKSNPIGYPGENACCRLDRVLQF